MKKNNDVEKDTEKKPKIDWVEVFEYLNWDNNDLLKIINSNSDSSLDQVDNGSNLKVHE